MAVKIVSDSTADLPPDLARSLGIEVAPLNVHFGTEVFKDGVDLSADEFYRRLAGGSELPKTSQPSVGDFVKIYERVGQDADGILSIHLSSKVSGTFNSAIQASSEATFACPIEIVDTFQVSMGVGMVAIAAARAAQRGVKLEEAARIAREAAARCQCFALLDTLEYLQKGGRIGKVRALLGGLLKVRPMVIVRDGEAHELGKERTRAKGLARLRSITAGFGPLDELCILHSTVPDDASALAQELADLLPDGTEPFIARFGPVLGTYLGPGSVGVALLGSKTPSSVD